MAGASSEGKRAERPIRLLKAVVAGDGEAWGRFIERHYGFLFALAKPYARGDRDRAAELVLVALEGLVRSDVDGVPFYRLRKYLDSIGRFGKRSRFSSWLALVAKNLWRDWFRGREGRRALPGVLADAPEAVRALYAALFWDGLSEREAEAMLRSRFQPLSGADLAAVFDALWAALADTSLLQIYRDLLRRVPPVPIAEQGGAPGAVQVGDARPGSRPDGALAQRVSLEQAQHIAGLLKEALDGLPEQSAQVLGMMALRGLSGAEVQRIMGFRSRQRVYDEMARARRKIGAHLRKQGVTAEDVEEVIGLVDDVLEKNLSDGRPDR